MQRLPDSLIVLLQSTFILTLHIHQSSCVTPLSECPQWSPLLPRIIAGSVTASDDGIVSWLLPWFHPPTLHPSFALTSLCGLCAIPTRHTPTLRPLHQLVPLPRIHCSQILTQQTLTPALIQISSLEQISAPEHFVETAFFLSPAFSNSTLIFPQLLQLFNCIT